MTIDFSSLLGKSFATLVASGDLPDVPTPEDVAGADYVSYLLDGVSLVLDQNGIIEAVQFYGTMKDGFSQFEGQLPDGLSLGMGRDEMRALLGAPTLSQEAPFACPPFGPCPPWDKWVRARHSLHAEYDFDVSSIRLFSLSG